LSEYLTAGSRNLTSTPRKKMKKINESPRKSFFVRRKIALKTKNKKKRLQKLVAGLPNIERDLQEMIKLKLTKRRSTYQPRSQQVALVDRAISNLRMRPMNRRLRLRLTVKFLMKSIPPLSKMLPTCPIEDLMECRHLRMNKMKTIQ